MAEKLIEIIIEGKEKMKTAEETKNGIQKTAPGSVSTSVAANTPAVADIVVDGITKGDASVLDKSVLRNSGKNQMSKTLFGYSRKAMEYLKSMIEAQFQGVIARLNGNIEDLETKNAELQSKVAELQSVVNGFREKESYIARTMIDLSIHVERSEHELEEKKAKLISDAETESRNTLEQAETESRKIIGQAEQHRRQVLEETEQHLYQVKKELEEKSREAAEEVMKLKKKLDALKQNSVAMLTELTDSFDNVEESTEDLS